MDSQIEFVFQGKTYTVSSRALEFKKIVLPDGRVLKVGGWFEFDDQPPQIYHLIEVPTLITGNPSVEEIANQVKGVLAQRVSS